MGIPVEESGNVLRRVLQESLLQQEFNALFRVHVELFSSERELLSPGCIFTVKIKKKIWGGFIRKTADTSSSSSWTHNCNRDREKKKKDDSLKKNKIADSKFKHTGAPCVCGGRYAVQVGDKIKTTFHHRKKDLVAHKFGMQVSSFLLRTLCDLLLHSFLIKETKENGFGFFLLPVFARIVQTLHLGRDFGDLIFELLSKSIKKKK